MIVKRTNRLDNKPRQSAAFSYTNMHKRNNERGGPATERRSYANGPRNPMVTLSDGRRNLAAHNEARRYPGQMNTAAGTITAPGDPFKKEMRAPFGGRYAANRRITKYSQNRFDKKPLPTVPEKKTALPVTGAKKIFRKVLSGKTGLLRIIPLGGCEEVGRNMTVFEYVENNNEKNKDIILLDMGLQFPEEDMPGIDYIIPNVEYLRGQERNIRAVIFSHGHLDHIGAAPILLEKLGNPPIVGRNLTIEMIKHRQEDYKKGSSKSLKTIYIKDIKDQFKFGNFTAKFFAVEHSIMDAVGVILENPSATIIHPGDWTMEADPQGRPMVDYRHLANLKTPTIMMLESLAATHQGGSKKVTEKEMIDNLTKIIEEAPGRIIIGTFASQVERIKQIIDIASGMGKKIALDGFSMKMNIEIAQKLG
ncbi:MAG TPA: ribonuclease J, partial [Patescibacteria group bacterium]|nr:ribonuclease J [Patescibacteria group bacterium]